jgi:transposase
MIAFFAKTVNIFFEYVTDIFSTFTKISDETINDSKEISAHTILESLPLPPPGIEKNLTPILTDIQKELFEYWIRCSSSPQWLVSRCCIILDLNNGKPKKQIAREQRKGINTVRKWAKRWLKENRKLSKLGGTDIKPKDYREKVLICLGDAARSGRPIIFTAEQVVQIIALACEIKDNSDSHISHWTWNEISWEAAARGIVKFISPSSVGRFLSEAHIKPHQSRYWLNASPEDPERFRKEAKTVCDLYHKAQ